MQRIEPTISLPRKIAYLPPLKVAKHANARSATHRLNALTSGKHRMAGPGERLEYQSFLENNGKQRLPCDLDTFRVARASCLIPLPNYFYGSRSAKFHHLVDLPAC